LENVDKTAPVALLAKLTDHHPKLYDWLETTLPPAAGFAANITESRPRPQSQVSEQVYRKHIKNILRSSSAVPTRLRVSIFTKSSGIKPFRSPKRTRTITTCVKKLRMLLSLSYY